MAAVKICGLRKAEHLQLCARLGAEFVGLVAYPPSPRHLSLMDYQQLAPILRELPLTTASVLVTVDATDELLASYFAIFPPRYVQCHGTESPARLREIASRFGCKIIKALPIATQQDCVIAADYTNAAEILLFDAKPQPDEMAGGNARFFDWNLLQGQCFSLPWMLSA
jgi:phosphoribosylanthranilate isomerase